MLPQTRSSIAEPHAVQRRRECCVVVRARATFYTDYRCTSRALVPTLHAAYTDVP